MTGREDKAPERVLLVSPTGRDAALAASALRGAQVEVATSKER